MYYIGICDDGKNICADMEEMVFRYASDRDLLMGLEIWYTGEALCQYLKEEHPLDILFLDIDLLTMSGIEVAQFIRSQMENRWMQIIYISGNASYAQGAVYIDNPTFMPNRIEAAKKTALSFVQNALNGSFSQVKYYREEYNFTLENFAAYKDKL